MIWAVLGISVMAGTTATLTTLLSEHQQSVAKLPSIKGETVSDSPSFFLLNSQFIRNYTNKNQDR